MTETDVRTTLRDMWETRPERPHDGRKVGGVAEGLGRRYGLDPVLFRVGFVVTAFWGIGFFLYAAGWLLLPRPDGDRRAGARPYVLFALVVFALVVIGVFPDGEDGGWEGGPAVGLLVTASLLFLLHRARGDRPAVTSVDPAAPTVSLRKDGAPGTTGVPSWDPLGAAPFAWDLPEPSPAPPPPPVRRLPVTAVTLALALLAGGVTALVLLATGALSPSSMPVLFGVVLTVLGLGLVVGSFVHAGRGLIPAAVLVGALTWATVAAPLENWPDGGAGEFRVAPTTAAQVLPSYTASAGAFDLDLTGLDLGTGTGPVATSIALGAGDVQVRVPADADVTFTGSVGFGHVGYESRRESVGRDAQLAIVDDLGDDGVASGRPLEITVTANLGNVELRRG